MGERIAAEWVEEHPNWRLHRITCRIGIPPREQDVYGYSRGGNTPRQKH
jgi:hypothetical protein